MVARWRATRVVAAERGVVLPDLQGQERRHREAERLGESSGPQPVTTPGRGQLVEPRLHGAAGDPELARRLEHADPRVVGEQGEQSAVEIVHDGSWSWAMLRSDSAYCCAGCQRRGKVTRHDDDPRDPVHRRRPHRRRAQGRPHPRAAQAARRAGGVRREPATRSRSPRRTTSASWSATRPRPRSSTSSPSAWTSRRTAGPETGNRDSKSYVLRSGSARFVFTGGVTPDSPVLDHHRKHGDGVVDLAHGGARRRQVHRARPRAGRDDPRRAARRHRRARHGPDRRDRDVRRDPAHPGRPVAATTARSCPATSPPPPR